MSSTIECVICYEGIGETNCAVTPCGHRFCFQCIAKCMMSGTENSCPYCRADLIERTPIEDEDEDNEDEDNEDEDNEDEDEDEDEDDDEDDEDSDENEGSLEEIVKRFEEKGYTLTDAISLLTDRISTISQRYTPEFMEQIQEDFENIIDDVDEEHMERRAEQDDFAKEDKRAEIHEAADILLKL